VTTLALDGRGSELASLDELIAGASDGGGGLVVRGEAGIGKSTLLAAARDRADAADMAVLTAAGVQSEAHLPFAGLHQLLQPLFGDLDAPPGPHRAAIEAAFGMSEGVAANPFLIALATLALLGEAAARSPLLIIAEDAQWLDHPTRDVLAFVARRVSLEPIVLLFAVRDDVTNPFESAHLSEIRLLPLERCVAAELLDTHASRLAPAVRERLLDEAAGNPLALVELPAALSAEVNRWPYQRARVLLAYGAWLRRQRRVGESRTPLRAARDAFDALGASAWGERARQELRAPGETSRSRTPEARDELTLQELPIAQMAAEALTNREIGQQLYLSPRTVGSHLYRLLPKLGISSRAQLNSILTGD